MPAVNSLRTLARWAFAKLTEIHQIESDFKAKVASALDAMIAAAAGYARTFRLTAPSRGRWRVSAAPG